MSIPRMRVATGVLKELRALDPETQVTLHYIRQIIKQKKVPVTEVGNKKLVDVDKVIAFLAEGCTTETPPETGEIRRVKV